MNIKYANIVLPLAQNYFTFQIGEELNDLVVGECVEVPLGKSKIYIGIVWGIHETQPDYKTIKSVHKRVGNSPRLSALQIKFWEWISSYYICTLGEVMRAAIPSALKPEGFSSEEFMKDLYKPLTVTELKWGEAINSIDELNQSLEGLKRAKIQYRAVLELCQKANIQDGDTAIDQTFTLLRNAFDYDSTIIKALEKKGIIKIIKAEVTQNNQNSVPYNTNLPILSNAQDIAFKQIIEGHKERDVALLHGITGSGKTEIYIRLIDSYLREGRDVLYLLPEIALTSQLIERMKRYFGDRVITYHSKHPPRKRVENYLRVNRHHGGELIIGVRSAIFMPIGDLSLVIVDEEHESSFKQTDPAPRYNARDCSIVLASMCGAKVVLGSATPSIESYTNAKEGKYTLVNLSERYGVATLPKVIISDNIRSVKRGERKIHFNKILLDSINESIADGNQVILFQNRRGFSPYIECNSCGWTSRCEECNVTLTLHKMEGKLRCHYCGFATTPPQHCPSCKVGIPDAKGFGTEKIEEELQKLIPSARISRLDRDTSRTEKGYKTIISDFSRGDSDILIGTQMLAKGFDFSGVSLVGILNADNLLNYPDFRASERAFQLMTQVAGRAGRAENKGTVIIQTSQPEHPTIKYVADNNYMGMVHEELQERSAFLYPPYCRVVTLSLKHRDKQLLYDAATVFGNEGRKIFGNKLLGPQPPSVDKIKREYILCFMLKVERTSSFARAKEMLLNIVKAMGSDSRYHSITAQCNVDPQ